MLWTNIYPIFRARSNLFKIHNTRERLKKNFGIGTYLLPCGLQTIMDFSLTTLPVETALIFWTFWTWAMDCMIIYLCMCVYKVKKERRRAGDYFISLVRVTSNTFFTLLCWTCWTPEQPEKEKRKTKKKKLFLLCRQNKERERERDEKRGGGGGGLVGRASAAAAIIVLVFNVIIIIFFFFFFSSTTSSSHHNIFKVVALRPFRPCHSAASRLA